NHEKKFVVQVIDNGNGIEDTSKIFQTFYTTKAVGKGTGLGLGIVEQIISNLDGLIKVDSTLGEGTTFTITIPNSKILVNP
ncbi:MAG: HAMP domain-containing histidine kinase, partial [Bacteriovoracaceae bacterium]|nr:HAMP domain-containing histidine kinase [Bacteriovoracaceae bacterium]